MLLCGLKQTPSLLLDLLCDKLLLAAFNLNQWHFYEEFTRILNLRLLLFLYKLQIKSAFDKPVFKFRILFGIL